MAETARDFNGCALKKGDLVGHVFDTHKAAGRVADVFTRDALVMWPGGLNEYPRGMELEIVERRDGSAPEPWTEPD